MTLDEWSESTEAHQKLKTNLQANIDVYLSDLTMRSVYEDLKSFKEWKESFLRFNLIMVRQFESEIRK